MRTINERFLDAIISHKINIERMGMGLSNELINKVTENIKNNITIPDDFNSLTEVQMLALTNEISSNLENIILSEYETFTDEMVDVVAYEKRYNENLLTRILPEAITVQVSNIDPVDLVERLKGAENTLISEAFEQISKNTSTNFKNKLIEGYRQGKNPRDIARNIYQIESKGLTNTTDLKKLRNQFNTLSRTAVNSINSEVNKDILDRNKSLLRGYQWVSTLDGRTSFICMSRDGNIYETDTTVRPPAHYNCRSMLTPVFKSDTELGIETRASMDGQIPEKTTYEEWLRGKSDSFIKRTLGEKRGKLFIEGNLSLDRFTDSTGRVYTLRELEEFDNIDLNEI